MGSGGARAQRVELPNRSLRHSSVAQGAVGVVRPVITVSPGALEDSRACGRWGGGGGWLVEP